MGIWSMDVFKREEAYHTEEQHLLGRWLVVHVLESGVLQRARSKSASKI